MLPSLDLSTTLLNILRTSYTPNSNENVVPAESTDDDGESSGEEEEYYVCLKCEELGIVHEEAVSNSVNNTANPRPAVIVKQEPKTEPMDNESQNSNESTVLQAPSNSNVPGSAATVIKDEPIASNSDDEQESNPQINDRVSAELGDEQSGNASLPGIGNTAVIKVEPTNLNAADKKESNPQVSDNVIEMPTESVEEPRVAESVEEPGVADASVIKDEPSNLTAVDEEEFNPPVNAQAIEANIEHSESTEETHIANVSEGAPAADTPTADKHEPAKDTNASNAKEIPKLPLTQSIAIQTEPIIDVEPPVAQEISTANMPDVADSIDHENPVDFEPTTESNDNESSGEKETTEANLPAPSFATPFLNRSQTVSVISQNTSTTASPVNISAQNSRSNVSTPLPQTPQVKIESKELLSLFQQSPDNLLNDLSAFLRNRGVEIVGEDDPEFVNEFKDVKIKIETPRTIKSEPRSRRKRRRSPKFYTPAKRRAAAKGSIGIVTTKTGEKKVFKEWDDDEVIESD